MPEKSAFMFHHNFYPKPKVDLEDGGIIQETRQILLELQQKYDIISKHWTCALIGNENLHRPKFTPLLQEEIENLLEAGLIERSMSPYATPIIVVPRKSKPGSPLPETKRLVIDYHKLNKQIPKVQTTQAKSKGSLVRIDTAK